MAIFEQRYLNARKQHICDLCNRPIEIGERYKSEVGIFDGFQVMRYHLRCENIIDTYASVATDEFFYWLTGKHCVNCDRANFCEIGVLNCEKALEEYEEREND